MKNLHNISAVLLITVLVFACNKNATDPNLDVDAEILKEMKAYGIPSLTACIVKEDKIVWEGTYGYADIVSSKPADRQTLYTIMSISKVFIATSVLQLCEKNQLNLDADINVYLPYAVRNPKYPDEAITTRMLLTHTSGLAWPEDEDHIPNFYYLFPTDEMPGINEWVPDYILPGGSNYRSNVWKDFKPGEMELYSNIATSVLALVVEHISGMDYREYCKENILEPLEMNNTAFNYSNLNSDLLATPYWNMQNSIHLFNYMAYPVGNLKSNIDDFSHFLIAILNFGLYKNNRILSKESVEKMLSVNNPTTGIGLIWANCLGDCIGHSGGGEGFSSRMEIYKDRDIGMVIFTNRRNSSVYPKGEIYELIRYQCNKY